MARRVFFSFSFSDVSRAFVVRKSGALRSVESAGFADAAEFETIKAKGDAAIQRWIDAQLVGTSVTVVLVGAETCKSKWVAYEISESIKRGNGMLGISIAAIKDFNGQTTSCCGNIPSGYPFYLWQQDNGYENLGRWIESAAVAAGR